jgi:hypothetical protein
VWRSSAIRPCWVISDGETVTEVAARFGVARKTVHAWLAKYEAGGLENLKDGSHRPRSCPHQIGSAVEAPASPDPIPIVLLPGFEYRMREWRNPKTHEIHWRLERRKSAQHGEDDE